MTGANCSASSRAATWLVGASEPMSNKAVILNAGSGAWAFEALADALARAFDVPVSETPATFNYVLGWDAATPPRGHSFVPLKAIEIATDKRELARIFARHDVAMPATFLIQTPDELRTFLRVQAANRWVLKWPTGCGGAGHRLVDAQSIVPDDWPRPFVVQRFIEMKRPEVFRVYAVAGELFGWNTRRFTDDRENPDPFVAHARGAFYDEAGDVPGAALEVARHALQATGLLNSFGCADLLRDQNGDWVALEVNTDGLWMHVDRDTLPSISREIETRLAAAFAKWCSNET